jgi:hypothetical protein
MVRALTAPGKDGAVVVEVNAIRHAPLVDKLVACEVARKGDGAQFLAEAQAELGLDLTEDVDRIAFDKNVFAVSGFFEKLTLPAELGAGEAYGDAGRIFHTKSDDGKDVVVGKLGNDLLLTGFNEQTVRDALDRAEGRSPASSPFPDGLAGGEIYGLLGQAFLRDMFAGSSNPVLTSFTTLVTETQVRVAVDDAAALSLDLKTNSADEANDLSRALGGAVAAARAQAAEAGETQLAGLLEQARVKVGDDGRVAFDVAVPGEHLLRMLGCSGDGKPLPPANASRTSQDP